MPRLAPIDPLPTWTLRLAAWLSRRKLGTVISAIPVVYARFPRLARAQYTLLKLAERVEVGQRLRVLIELHVSAQNGCAFCADLHRADAVAKGIPATDIRSVSTAVGANAAASLRTSGGLDARELAALDLARAMSATGGPVEDAVFERARAYFDERGLVEIVWLSAFTGYLNSIARALELEADGVCPMPFAALPETPPATTLESLA